MTRTNVGAVSRPRKHWRRTLIAVRRLLLRSNRGLETAPTGLLLLLLCTSAFAADPTLYPLHIAGHRPPCAEVEGLPITPEDPGAVVTGRGTRCYGTDPRELVLMMPLDAPVWLETAAPHPAEWIRVGPVLVDAQRYQAPPLGLKLMEGGDAVVLETRFGRAATLTRLTPGRWLPVKSADGERYWMMVETGRVSDD